jgi:hypothetical protein
MRGYVEFLEQCEYEGSEPSHENWKAHAERKAESMSELNSKEKAELQEYSGLQRQPHNATCECGQSCYWPQDRTRWTFAQCFDCFEAATWNWVDHDRGEP